jgi:hypothetical protein
MTQDFGIRVAAPGQDARTALDKDVHFTTKYSTLKIFKAGTLSVTTDGSGDGTVSVNHGLGYAPGFFVFRKVTASWSFLDASSYSNAFLPVGGVNYWAPDDLHHAVHAYTDSSDLIVQIKGGATSTLYEFRYYILVDLSKAFSGTGRYGFTKDFGFKVAKPGFNVLATEEYNMAFSSKYKSLQHHSVHKMTETLTLPAMFASQVDTFEEEGTYVDFNHNLGYPPLFLAFFECSSPSIAPTEIPYNEENSIDATDFSVTGFADSTRVRLSFWRSSTYFISLLDNWSSMTITLHLIMFTENLLGANIP